MTLQSIIANMLKRKKPDDAVKGAEKGGLEKTLGVWDLIILGVGAIIGSGIFAVVGIAAAGSVDGTTPGAGPALIVSMVIAAIACVFSALCYSEFAAMIPVAGGAYTYTFATLGEFAAWLVGWIMMLEYVIAFIAVSCAWSNYLMQFLKGFSHVLPACIVNPPVWLVNDFRTSANIISSQGIDYHQVIPYFCGIPVSINLPAVLIILFITMILVKGTKDSTKMAAFMVVLKLGIIGMFIFAGMFYIQPENWVPFAPNGANGIFMGAFIIFFAYIGFDALATTAEECKNPQRDLPRGIIGSLIVTTIVYTLVALVLTGIYPTGGEVETAFLNAPVAYSISNVTGGWISKAIPGIISVGVIAGLTSVLLVMELAATRILYAMSRDHFIPEIFQKLHPKFHTPYILTWTICTVSIFGTLALNLDAAAALCNFGTFTSFIIVCIAVLILRKIDPERPRPFKVPLCPWFPLLGIICCGGLMFYSMVIAKGESARISTELFLIWIIMGILIYSGYGYFHNRKAEILIENSETTENEKDESKINI